MCENSGSHIAFLQPLMIISVPYLVQMFVFTSSCQPDCCSTYSEVLTEIWLAQLNAHDFVLNF